MKKSIITLLVIISVVGAVIARSIITHAQTTTIDLALSSVPINPQPGDQVVITAQSYGTDLSQDDTTWTYNGKTIASGIGITRQTVVAPASGMVGTVTLAVSGNSFDATSSSIILRPASVDLLWEGADSYTPPFYKGRAVPSAGGVIRVTAVPSADAPLGISYNWSENGSALPSSSGYNKSSILFQHDVLNPTEHIAISASSGSFSGGNTVDITPGSPTVVAYFNNDGFIDYANGSTNSLSTGNSGTIIHFEPFYFSAPHGAQKDLNFTYTDTSGNVLTPSDLQNELRLTAPDGGGDSQFTVSITTVRYSLQNLNHLFDINFL